MKTEGELQDEVRDLVLVQEADIATLFNKQNGVHRKTWNLIELVDHGEQERRIRSYRRSPK